MAVSFRDGKKYDNGREILAKHVVEQLSSNGRTIYTAVLWVDGSTSCNCPGWANRHACKHAKAAASATASVSLSNNAQVIQTEDAYQPGQNRVRPVLF
jgi:hypothetical protein